MRPFMNIRAMLLLAFLLPILPAQAQASRLTTVTIDYADSLSSPQIANGKIAFRQMQAFFDATPLKSGVAYSFTHDVLTNPLQQGYIDAAGGFGDGISAAASALNMLVHKTWFWGQDGIERPLFEQVHATTVRDDKVFGVFAVALTLEAAKPSDYLWRVNPAYDGPAPRISSELNTATAMIQLSVTFADECPPSAHHGLTDSLRALIRDRRIGVTVIPIADPAAAIHLQDDDQTPIASAWKGAGAIYFFENSDPAIWRNVPVRYWHTADSALGEVPAAYRDTLLKYRAILWDVYVMTVFSGNHEAGNVLAYVYHNLLHSADTNPIVAFNEWSERSAGISAASGLLDWHYGNVQNPANFDARFQDRKITLGANALFYANTYSARDLAQFYYHLATVGRQQGYYDTAVELLSIRTEIVSAIEGQIAHTAIRSATKDGYFVPGSPLSLEHAVNNDAGLLTFPDGREYAVAFTAFDATELEGDVIGLVIHDLSAQGQ